MSLKNQSIIVAPHPDDEIIGCFDILNDIHKNITIIYSGTTDNERRQEAAKLREVFPSVKNQTYHNSIPSPLLSKDITLYFPDPVHEVHPLHRAWGFMGEQIARSGMDVVFYTTIMNTPYIYEIEKPDIKESMLDRVYPGQQSLWKYEKKFVLFEGRCKWVF